MHRLDELDKKLLAELDKDCTIPLAEIAQKLNISRQLIGYRIKKLREKNIILGNFTVFDSGTVGYNWYRLLIRLLNISKKQKQDFLEYLKSNPYVMWLGEVGGRWDIVVNFTCKSPVNFNDIMEEVSVKFGSCVKEFEILVYVDVYDYSRSYLDPENFSRKEFFHKMSEDTKLKIDELDRKIIEKISKDATIDNSELGKLFNVSRNTIKNRIDKLREQKLILGFRTFINLNAIGYQSNMLFLQITKLDRERETELYYYLKMMPQISFVVKHVGKWKIGIEIETKSEEEFQKILLNIRSSFSDIIADFDTFPLIKDHVINYFPEGILSNLNRN